MSTHNFENLEVWKRGCDLAVKICVASNDSMQFALKDQIQRSAISIPSNIAEGAGRNSTKDFVRFLTSSQGSCGELRTQLHIHDQVCEELQLRPFEGTREMIQESRTLSRMIQGLISRVEADTTT